MRQAFSRPKLGGDVELEYPEALETVAPEFGRKVQPLDPFWSQTKRKGGDVVLKAQGGRGGTIDKSASEEGYNYCVTTSRKQCKLR